MEVTLSPLVETDQVQSESIASQVAGQTVRMDTEELQGQSVEADHLAGEPSR